MNHEKVVMKKNLAKALMDACTEPHAEPQKLGLGGIVKSAGGALNPGNALQGLSPVGMFQQAMPLVNQVTGLGQLGLNPIDPGVSQQLGVLRGRENDLYTQQQGLAQALLAQSQGQGPNPVMSAFQQSTGQNVANQAALMAGQRGGSYNPGLMARQIAMQGAGIQQQAAGQAATLGAQQQLAAQQALQQQQAQMANQALQGQSIYTGQQDKASDLNARIQIGNQQSRNQILGGLLGAGGSMLAASEGGAVPGAPQVPGDSEANDTVPTMLSPGEIVIPRTIAQHPDAPTLAAHFVRETQARGYGGVISARNGKMNLGGTVGVYAAPEVADPLGIRSEIPMGYGPMKTNLQPGKESGFERTWSELQYAADERKGKIGKPPAPSLGLIPTDSFKDPSAVDSMEQLSTQSPDVPKDVIQPMPSAPAASQGFGQLASGIRGEAKILGGIEDKKVAEWEKYIDTEQTRAAAHKKTSDDIRANMDKLSNEIASGIDSNRYWANKGTGSKVSTILGVMLGGIGQGLAGGENMAWKALQANIDRDIDEQKATLGSKQTMFSDNLRMLGNLQSAEEATRLQTLAIFQGKLAKVAAESGNPLIQERAKQELGKLEMQKEAGMAKLAENQTNLQMQQFVRQKIQSGEMGPEQAINFIPEKDRPEATKEVEALNGYKSAISKADTLFAQADQLSALSSADPTNTTDDSIKLSNLNAEIERAAREGLRGQGTIQESEIKRLIGPYLINSKDIALGKTDVKLNGFKSMLQSSVMKGFPTLKRHGIPVDMKVEAPAEIKVMNGQKYQKVSGGWQKLK